MRGLSKFPVAWSPGELDGSGRYYTDEELAAGAATGGKLRPAKREKASAA